MIFPDFKNELAALQSGYSFVAGCDEVGVAPVAGPVVAAACIIKPECVGSYRSKHKWYFRVRDSKTVNEQEREILEKAIKENCLSFGVGVVSPETIDSINIHHASLLAMKLAVEEMLNKFLFPDQQQKLMLFLDGRFTIKNLGEKNNFKIEQKSVIDADALILSVSAASIIAKVHRDAIMKQADETLPGYGFARHKGYNTKAHRKAIEELGISEFHRKSFLKDLVEKV